MRYKEIVEQDYSYAGRLRRNDQQIARALLKDYSGPLTKSLQSYNVAVRELAQTKQSGTGARVSTYLGKRLQPNNVASDPMFMGMATSMFRMGRGKKDLGRLLTTDEPADILSNIKKFSEKGWLQQLQSATRDDNPNASAQFKTPENLRKQLATAPASLFGGEVENMIKDETDVVKFYALVDFFEVILTDLNLKDKASRFTPGNIAKGFTDFERTVTGQ